MSLPTLEPISQARTEPVLTVATDAARACVQISGELDAALAPRLAAELSAHLQAGRRYLRLELSGVTFIDTSALSVVLAAHNELLRERGTLVLTGVRRPVSRLLELTELDRVLFVGGPRSDIESVEISG